MKTSARTVLVVTLVLLAGASLWAISLAAPGKAPLAGGAPTVVAYQGEVRMGGSPYTGDGYFKFAVVNTGGDTSYWSNDGTSSGGGAPSASVQLAVSEGLFSILLGDASLAGMTQPLTADVFSQPDRYLRVWFSSDNGTFDQLVPDTRIAAVPYALQAQEAANAETVDGLHASELGSHYQNVVVVAKSGGDYTSVQAAIDSITDAAADNAYLVWVAPGVYEEQVTMKPYVHLQGAGQEATVITSNASSSAWPPDQATLVLAGDTSLRDLAVGNSGGGEVNTALLATAGMTRTLVADVTARALGSGESSLAIVLSGSGTGVRLQQVTALGENSSIYNFALHCDFGAAVVVHGGAFTGRGGEYARGISSASSGTTLEADNVTALAEEGSLQNYGLFNTNSAVAELHGGTFTARGGADIAWGIFNGGSGSTTLDAMDVTALGENANSHNLGLGSYHAAVLRGGSFTGRGGTHAFGIEIAGSLEADNITALGGDGSSENYGLENYDQAEVVLRGGAYTGRGGGLASGIYMSGTLTTLEAESVTALAEDGGDSNIGLYTLGGAAATLSGGSFTARGGEDSFGIHNAGSGTTMQADNVTAVGENGSVENYGLVNSGTAALRGGALTGRGGSIAGGVLNNGSGVALEAHNITAVGKDGGTLDVGLITNSATADITQSVLEGASEALLQSGGTVRLGVSQLDGGAIHAGGTLICYQVFDGNYAAYTCP